MVILYVFVIQIAIKKYCMDMGMSKWPTQSLSDVLGLETTSMNTVSSSTQAYTPIDSI